MKTSILLTTLSLGFSLSSIAQTTLDPRPWSEVFPKRPAAPSTPTKAAPPATASSPTVPPKSALVDWQAAAITKYPELGINGSSLNKRFIEAFIERSKTHPEFFRDTRWPVTLADEIASPSVAPPTKPVIPQPVQKDNFAQRANERDTSLETYQIELQKLIKEVPLGDISDSRQADELLANCNSLVVTMAEHSKRIFGKWVQVTSLLSDSGLDDRGLQKVFLKQFTEEDALENVRILTACRTTKDQLLALRVSGCERTQAAFQTLFSAYASLCERDRKPSGEPADFVREIRLKFDSLAANLFVFGAESKALKARLHPETR